MELAGAVPVRHVRCGPNHAAGLLAKRVPANGALPETLVVAQFRSTKGPAGASVRRRCRAGLVSDLRSQWTTGQASSGAPPSWQLRLVPLPASRRPLRSSVAARAASQGSTEMVNGSVASKAAARVATPAADITRTGNDVSQGVELTWDELVSPKVAEEVTKRLQRLEVLMLVRRLYRDVARSERVVRIPAPRVAAKEGGTQEFKVKRTPRRSMNVWLRRAWGARLEDRLDDGDAPEPVLVDSAVEVLNFAADVRDLAESLKSDLLRLQDRLPLIFPGHNDVAAKVRSTVETLEAQLEAQALRVEESLSDEQRREALEERQRELRLEEEENVQARVLRRLEGISSTGQVVLGRVVGERIAGVGAGLSRINLADGLTNLAILKNAGQASSSALQTLVDLWRRLNGLPAASDLEPLASGLPRPDSALAEAEEKKLQLLLQVEALDKKLMEASRARETRLRQRNSPARTRLLASEIRSLDDEVNDVRKQLAVRVLELDMHLIYMALEAELLLHPSAGDLRSDEEEALLIAEFGLLDTDLAPLRTAVDRQEAILIEDEELDVLTLDIPDLKQRLGIVEAPTVPLGQRVQLSVQEAQGKLSDGSSFLWRGLRLLGGDISYSLRLFWVALNGATLKAREVQTLRRTAKDILVLIPFTIILIAPITPVGHVAVFAFLQKYFPGFFPSSFSSRRHEVMKRYELLKLELETGATSASLDKEAAKAMKAAAEAETFEAREDEETASLAAEHGDTAQSQRWLSPGAGATAARGRSPDDWARSPRVLRDDPKKLRLLQEKLPGIAGFLADLKAKETNRVSAQGDASAPSSPAGAIQLPQN